MTQGYDTELDLTEKEQQALDAGALTMEQVERTRWFAQESDRCRAKLAPLLTHIAKQDDMEVTRHGTATDSSGEHEVSMTFTIDGEPFDGGETADLDGLDKAEVFDP